MPDKPKIDTLNPACQRMQFNLAMVQDIMGGTKRMRDAGERWLPREKLETVNAYMNRLNRSVFFNGYKRSLDGLCSKPFSRQVKISENLPKEFDPWLDDCDLQGRRFEILLKDLFYTGWGDGLNHVLVEYPETTPGMTVAQKSELEVRPYLVQIDARQVIAFRYEIVNGNPRLIHVRFKESVCETVGEWGDVEITQIRVLEPGLQQVWREDEKKNWVLFKTYKTTLMDIPWVTFGVKKKSIMEADPPLIDMAWMNIQHWQSHSDQAHILHVVRAPILFGKGIHQTDAEGKKVVIEVGPNAAILTEDTQADLKYVEHTGAAIEAGQKEIESIENRMAVYGLQPLVRRDTVERTATEVGTDREATNSDLGASVTELEDAADQILYFMGKWEGIDTPEEKMVTIFKDFGITMRDQADLDALFQARQAGEISQATYLAELQRRNVIAQDINIEQEIADVRQEPPKLSSFDISPTADPANPNYVPPPPPPVVKQ
jgi:hypothetical protein